MDGLDFYNYISTHGKFDLVKMILWSILGIYSYETIKNISNKINNALYKTMCKIISRFKSS